ncbi:G-type lectin S-receptor-like serine/threonine-protein kinase At4g27290 isoform X2 [Vicia villosa]|uniref:G-type lectin S-receptor-like serine/threonine-protein kinase At4g27290 isoform X2 n=1 Tax=Vicia villosa TaxID=3911 RepID=UPI00273B1DB0|nr:G-type lectin S-receptor-like serine/threonine-protein kinase At4g27290 isoform X2 [Vicia villosa]
MANILPIKFLVISNIVLLLFFSQLSTAIDTITQFQSLDDGNTLVSSDGTFELGFFRPGSSTNRYVGIWYKNISNRRIVWVANRDNPIKDDNSNSTMLTINKEGNLVLLTNNNKTLVWSTNITTQSLSSTSSHVAQLLDNGNFVIKDNNKKFLWQGFDFPCDTLLPDMKLGWNLETGHNRRLTSWKNWDDPSSGNLTWSIVLSSNPEVILKKGSTEFHRSGPWNGIGFSGAPALSVAQNVEPKLVNNSNEVYFTYSLVSKSKLLIIYLNQTIGFRERIVWTTEENVWKIFEQVPRGDGCDIYNSCGSYGNCNPIKSPVCECLDGFKPKSSQNLDTYNWTQGCARKIQPIFKCMVGDGFTKFSGLKLPETTHTWVDAKMKLEDCKKKCLKDCSCTAYSNLDVRGDGSGCCLWFGDLIDLRHVSSINPDLYVRVNASSIVSGGHKKSHTLTIAITIPLVIVFLLVTIVFYIYKRKRKQRGIEDKSKNIILTKKKKEDEQDFELPFFNLSTMIDATNNFSNDNKLGEGGFGPVYKGILALERREIAVKRLSRSSKQGTKEFKNEVILCSKLQHRNLVKVLGCCIQGEERMLIYEYMPNRSLDSFIFDPTQKKLLDWSKRFNIICGIARGLLYLHQDSRLRIIHRDLKPSNILLDSDMNPKISDFGLAKICGDDQVEGNTNRVVGTHGYMAPEYAIDGLFSIKSDVFSFGILLLEIVSGKKNKRLTYPSSNHSLVGHAWRLWKEGISEELIDDCVGDSFILSEALRSIQVGLLCLQYHPNNRPNMASVLAMLTNEIVLSQPKEPGFIKERASTEGNSTTENLISSSINEVTISLLDVR